MRSLTFKLVLAFLLTSIAGMALAAVFIRQSVTTEFDSYVITQQRADFVDQASAYYERTGSWEGLDSWLREQGARRLAEATPPRRPQPISAGQCCAYALCWPTAPAVWCCRWGATRLAAG
jgi:hypothetical protein